MDITDIKVVTSENEEFNRILNSIKPTSLDLRDSSCKQLNISSLAVSTITVVSDISASIDLTKVYTALSEDNNLTYQADRNAPPPQGKRMFYNCMKWEIMIKDGKDVMKVSSKVFPNGKFQFAGFKTMKAITLVPRIMLKMIREAGGLSNDNIMNKPRVIQINSGFYILKDSREWLIIQTIMAQLLMSQQGISNGGRILNVTFKPEKYPGINVKFQSVVPDKKITLLIFATGSVLINGGCMIQDYKDAYDMLTNFVIVNKDIILVKNLMS